MRTNDVQLQVTVMISGDSIDQVIRAVTAALRGTATAQTVLPSDRRNNRSDERPPYDANRLISINSVATMLGVSRSMVYALRERGEMPPVFRIGRSIRWRLSDIEEWMESRSVLSQT